MIPGCAVILFALFAHYIDRYAPRPQFEGSQVALLLAGLLLLICGVAFHNIASVCAKRRVSLAVLALTAVVLTLSVVEIVYRCLDPHGLVYYSEAARYEQHKQDNEDFAYIHEPGIHGVFQGVTVDINSEGFRWPEFPVKKAKGTKRLLVLGDSVVFGWGVEQQQIFPAVLQDMFHQRNMKWDVVAAGVGSWNTRTEFEWFWKRGLEYEPDLVLLYIVGNDIDPHRRGRTAVSKELLFPELSTGGGKTSVGRSWGRGLLSAVWRYSIRYSAILEYVQHLRRRNAVKNSIRGVDAHSLEDAPQWKDMEAALLSLAGLCQERGIVLIAAMPANLPDGLLQRCQACLAAAGTPYRILNAEIFNHYNSRVDGHPDAVGHRMMAEDIWTFIQPLLNSEDSQ